METDLEFVEVVDSIVRDFHATGLLQHPCAVQNAAAALSEVLCKGFSENVRREYIAQMEQFIRVRIAEYFAGLERSAARQGQN